MQPRDLHYHEHPLVLVSNNREFFVSYQNKQTINRFENSLPITKVNNLSVRPVDGNVGRDLYVPGTTIAITVNQYEYGYFHLLVNLLAEIEVLKKEFPEANIKIIKLGNPYLDHFVGVLRDKGILDAYQIGEKDIVDFGMYDTIALESLVFIYSTYNQVATTVAHHELKIQSEDMVVWGRELVSNLQKRFSNNLPVENKEKIFLSALKENNAKRLLAKIMLKKLNGANLSDYEEKEIKPFSVEEMIEFVCRLMPKYQEVLLEQMFRKSGYKVINPSDYPLISDQAKLFRSASKIVGLGGASFVNTCFSDKETEVLILNNCPLYLFAHQGVVRSFIGKAEQFPDYGSPESYADAKEFFKLIKEKYPKFFV